VHSCTKVRELIKLSFRVVSGISRGMGILDGVHVPKGKGRFWKFFGPTGLNGIFLTEMYSNHV